VRCIICNSSDWQCVDEFRLKPEGMSMCRVCGQLGYPTKYKTEEELIEFYRKDYRSKPTYANLCSGQRKIHFHNAFLSDLWKQWRTEGIKEPVVGEVGAAHGMFLNYVKEQFTGAEIYGTELTVSYVRNAFHQYGIELKDELDYSKKYDLIATYKVAEHQNDIDLKLRKCVEALKPNGFIYIGVPIWFSRLCNFGMGGFDIEYYYSPNHINVWTRTLFQTLLAKVGLKVLKFNNSMYDDVYLCQRDDEEMKKEPKYEDPQVQLERLKRVKLAGLAFMEGRYQDAIDAWHDFPEAFVHHYEHNRAKLHKVVEEVGFEKAVIENIIGVAEKACPESAEINGHAGDLCMRYNQFDRAIEYFEKCLRLRPGYSPAIRGIAHSLRRKGDIAKSEGDMDVFVGCYEEAREITKYLAQISKGDEQDCINWIYSDNAKLPMR
jgi:tetratricopeptide (TPR) repeat protein